ncbi:hypothetical protein [Paludisphaera rhizosphaerae]|nr:hypothetical protein [Paludisphaera rhizosphaerae]
MRRHWRRLVGFVLGLIEQLGSSVREFKQGVWGGRPGGPRIS